MTMHRIDANRAIATKLFSLMMCLVGVGRGLSAIERTADAAEAKLAWQQEWDKTLEGAKKEGRLMVHGASEVPILFEEAFQKAYPDIKVTTVSVGRGTERIQRIMTERRAGQYLVDLYIGSPWDMFSTFLPANIIEPIQPLLLLPEVVDTSKWWKGRHHYVDAESKYIFIFEGAPQGGGIIYNQNLVEPKNFRSFWDLLDRKWKGKVVGIDPTVSGSHEQNLRFFYYNPQIGPEFVKRLYGEMDIVMSRDDRQVLDWLGAGKYAFAYFPRNAEDAVKQGLPIAEIPPGHFKEGAFVDPYTGLVSYMNRAPHPFAAKVAVNWLLSREGQIAFQKAKAKVSCDSCESLREDIPKDNLSLRRREGVNYMLTTRPEMIDMTPIRKLIKETLSKTK
jgi:ABC-type Fe3+ transport system substrate-binding protein